MSGRISFIGAGPGAADLITVRGARRIAEADVVVWAASLVAPECIREHARTDAELVDSSRLTYEDAVEIYRRAERDKLKIARVHSGDPSLWGAVQEQHDACGRMDLEVEIVPGVPAFSAAAAAVGRELTVPEVAQSVVLSRLEGGKTPMPEGEKVREFAKHGTTMALFLSAARTGQLVDELRAGGYADDVPVLVAYKVSWPDELLLRTTVGELQKTVKQHKLWRHTLFIVGRALDAGGTRSRLYHAGHFHTYRRADPTARRALRSEQKNRLRQPRTRRPSSDGDPDASPRSGEADGEDGTVPRPRAAVQGGTQPGSDAAWWAVRNWQDTARGGNRGYRTGTTSRRTNVDGTRQPDLFVSDQSSGAAETEVVSLTEEDTLAHDPGKELVYGRTSTDEPVTENGVAVEEAAKSSEESVADAPVKTEPAALGTTTEAALGVEADVSHSARQSDAEHSEMEPVDAGKPAPSPASESEKPSSEPPLPESPLCEPQSSAKSQPKTKAGRARARTSAKSSGTTNSEQSTRSSVNAKSSEAKSSETKSSATKSTSAKTNATKESAPKTSGTKAASTKSRASAGSAKSPSKARRKSSGDESAQQGDQSRE